MGKVKMHILRQSVDPQKAAKARELRRMMTPAERALWGQLRANRLDGLHFRRQQVIAGFIVDFYCHAARLVVEVDGSVHNVQQKEDAERECLLKELRLRVLRFSNAEIETGLPDVLRQIRTAAQRKAEPAASCLINPKI
jgi:very-short-patch-repair endonuclease